VLQAERERAPASERILRLRRRLLKETPVVSIERARYSTEHWRSTEGSGLAPGIRVALAMKHVYQHMRHALDPDDRIAGAWTENPIGIPLDIERGLFNRVFAVECDRLSMLWFQARAQLRFFAFMLRRVGPLALYRRLRQLEAFGTAMPSIGLATIDRRKGESLSHRSRRPPGAAARAPPVLGRPHHRRPPPQGAAGGRHLRPRPPELHGLAPAHQFAKRDHHLDGSGDGHLAGPPGAGPRDTASQGAPRHARRGAGRARRRAAARGGAARLPSP
jgi:hypothetical protein